MGIATKIAWTDATLNFWWGCTRVSPGCVNCYAETLSKRFGFDEWGPGKPRRQIKSVAATVRKIVARAKSEGRRLRVFTNSMADFFDAEVAQEWRDAAWKVIRETAEWIDWQILTKRPENITAMLPKDWGAGYANVWLGVTTENQEYADKRIPILLGVPAAVRFASYEPALGPVDFTEIRLPEEFDLSRTTPAHINALTTRDDEHFFNAHAALDWIIVGGESGPGARPFDLAWGRSTVAKCKAAGVACFVKQMGDRPMEACTEAAMRARARPGRGVVTLDLEMEFASDYPALRVALAAHHGADPLEWPVDLRVQEFPESAFDREAKSGGRS